MENLKILGNRLLLHLYEYDESSYVNEHGVVLESYETVPEDGRIGFSIVRKLPYVGRIIAVGSEVSNPELAVGVDVYVSSSISKYKLDRSSLEEGSAVYLAVEPQIEAIIKLKSNGKTK